MNESINQSLLSIIIIIISQSVRPSVHQPASQSVIVMTDWLAVRHSRHSIEKGSGLAKRKWRLTTLYCTCKSLITTVLDQNQCIDLQEIYQNTLSDKLECITIFDYCYIITYCSILYHSDGSYCNWTQNVESIKQLRQIPLKVRAISAKIIY